MAGKNCQIGSALRQFKRLQGSVARGSFRESGTSGELITVKPGRKEHKEPNEYSLNVDISTGHLVRKVDQSKKLTSQKFPPLTSQHSRHSEIYKKKPKRVKRESSPSSGSDPRVTQFLDRWHKEYLLRFNEPYVFQGGKEGRLLKTLLRNYHLPRLEQLALHFFESADPWVRQYGGFTIGVFASQINKLVSTAKASPTQPQRKEMPR